ncbi:MAG: hypothetical protein ACP5KN_13820, partial [Armatimonadota bacterium]
VKVLPSVSLVYAKGKRIDDGTYAAVELAAETDFGKLQMGKPAFLLALEDRILPSGELQPGPVEAGRHLALSHLGSALATSEKQREVQEALGIDLDPDVGRKPIGFYTWSEELKDIFRRDTALQERFDPRRTREMAASLLLVGALAGDDALMAEYDRLNALYSRLTNPIRGLTAHDLLDALPEGVTAVEAAADEELLRELADRFADKPGFALFQPSRSKEMFLVWQAAAHGLSSMDELIAAIRDGRIDLEPDEQSGWYEYQQYALEPVLMTDQMPEGEKLELGEKYRALLEAHFKAMLSNIRETHVKQLELVEGMVEEVMPLEVAVRPHLECEPIAATYLRFGEAYEFLRGVLREHLGGEALTELHVLDEGAEPRDPPLGDELARMQRLMEGAYLLTCRDIGLQPELSGDLQERMGEAQRWLGSWRDDPDMQRDVRTMIPVARMPDVYWCVIGVRMAKLEVSFERVPEVRAPDPTVQVEPCFESATYWVPVEQFIEVTLAGGTEPLNREEFRALCDRWKTQAAIERAVKRELEPYVLVVPSRQEMVRAYPIWTAVAGVIVIGAAVWGIVALLRRRGG